MPPSKISITVHIVDMRRFAALVAVADAGGISAAATSLRYAQSTVSMQIKALEDELGVQLLDRGPGGSQLSAAGRRLLPHAREALRLAERMRRAVQPERAELRVGALESLAAEWLPDILTALRLGATEETDTPLALTVDRRGPLADGLREGTLDLVFVFDNGTAPQGPSQRVDEEPVVLVASPDHPLAQRPRLTPEELAGTEFLVAERGCTAQMLVDQFGRDLTGTAPVAMVTGSLAALRRLVANGQGVALLPYLSAAADLETGAMTCLEPPFPLRPVGIDARWRGDAEPAVRRRIAAVLGLARRNTLRHTPQERPA